MFQNGERRFILELLLPSDTHNPLRARGVLGKSPYAGLVADSHLYWAINRSELLARIGVPTCDQGLTWRMARNGPHFRPDPINTSAPAAFGRSPRRPID